jgi:hypothetical protein
MKAIVRCFVLVFAAALAEAQQATSPGARHRISENANDSERRAC